MTVTLWAIVSSPLNIYNFELNLLSNIQEIVTYVLSYIRILKLAVSKCLSIGLGLSDKYINGIIISLSVKNLGNLIVQ